MSELRILAAAALLAGGVAAAVSAVTVRYTADRVSHVASVRLGELAAGYAARAARGDASAVETAAAAQIWALDLEAALERVAARHGVALLPAHRQINGHIRGRLARDGVIRGPALESERLVSHGYTAAEKSLAANYAPGDDVAFHRDYKRLGVKQGDERRVAGVDHELGTVTLEGPDGGAVSWRPRQVGGKRGGVEVYRVEGIELRAGDRIRWTRNDAGLGLVNSHTAEVASVRGNRVSFRLEDGRTMELGRNDPQLRHLDHAWAATVHAFQGRTVDNVIAVMEANHPHLTTQKSFYVEISRARHRAELVTDDAGALRKHLESATGERVSALEGIGAAVEKPFGKKTDHVHGLEDILEAPAETSEKTLDKTPIPEPAKAPVHKRIEHDLGL